MDVSKEESRTRPAGPASNGGGRRWLRPRLSQGRFFKARRLVAYGLIGLFALLPYLKINGRPAVLLNVIERKFTLFGKTFLPSDTALLAMLILVVVFGVFLVTAAWGRIWCGWACPQTVYLEFVYRPIERWCLGTTGRGGDPKRPIPSWRLAVRFLATVLVSMFLAHTFLAYFVGVDQLARWILGNPFDHPIAFVVMAVTTGLMLFDFVYMREQLCTMLCPYGRLQSVLLDRGSWVIGYDRDRGEPRGKKKTAGADRPAGDCVDCTLCVQTCPTGIDIREGLQMECIGCAQCIDACDHVMQKIGRPKGLIRYATQDQLEGRGVPGRRWRLAIYPLAMVAALGGLVVLAQGRSGADLTLIRQPGLTFQMTDEGRVANVLSLKITNRTSEPATYRIRTMDSGDLRLRSEPNPVTIDPAESKQVALVLNAPRERFERGRFNVRLQVADGRSFEKQIECLLLGPMGPGASP